MFGSEGGPSSRLLTVAFALPASTTGRKLDICRVFCKAINLSCDSSTGCLWLVPKAPPSNVISLGGLGLYHVNLGAMQTVYYSGFFRNSKSVDVTFRYTVVSYVSGT